MHFGWQTRLARSSEINRVFNEGKRLNCGVFLLIAAERKNEAACGDSTRACFIASKKVSKRAVDRNRLKRRFRALFRENYSLLPTNMDLVLIARKSMLRSKFEDLEDRFKKACSNMQGK